MNRYQKILNKHYKKIFHYSGKLIALFGIIALLPLLVIAFYPEEIKYFLAFFIPAIIAIIFGIIISKINESKEEVTLSLKEGGLIVVFSWILAIIISAIPFITGLGMSITQSIFEAVSGWTTTGLTVVNESETPNIFLIWRSLMQYFGGIGLVVVMLSSILHPGGFTLYKAEGRSDKLLPNVKKSTQMIINIYFGFTIGGIILYILAGMNLFDAINHTMAALSTGGFSTKTASIGYWNNYKVEIVTWLLMIVGATNFATLYVLMKFKIKTYFRNGEIQLLFLLLAISTPLFVYFTAFPLLNEISEAWRHGIFQAITALSTTGFATLPMQEINYFGIMIIILLMLIGGGTGSTAGGIKLYRIFLIFRSLLWEIKRQFLPKNIVKKPYFGRGENKVYIKDEYIRETSNYIFIYLFTFVAGVLIFLAHGYNLQESMFEYASAQGTVGLSIGITSPGAPAGILWTMIAGMFLGRLEFMIIIYSIVKVVKDIKYSIISN